MELNRFDLFHAHLFYTKKTRSLGLLFHSKEYPAYDQQKFPINLGYCQQDSYLKYDETAMNLRNMLWFQVSVLTRGCSAAHVLVSKHFVE